MRIVHVITRLIVGGAQENTLLSCEGQHDLGHDVTLVTGPPAGPEGSLLQRARNHGYRVVVLPSLVRAIQPATDLQAYRQLVATCLRLRPHVVHTHSSKAGILGRWAAAAARRRGLRCGIVHTIHGLAFTASTSARINAAYRHLERVTAPLTDKIVCVADAMAEQSLAGGVGRAGQYVTVWSGMDTAPFVYPPVPRDAVRASLGIAPADVVVGTIARLFDLKGHDDLLDLAPDLCAGFPQLKFMWVGDGSLRGRFEKQIAAAGLQGKFILTGLVPPERIPELANAMDVLVHPSRREGLARALPQGQLAGCPAVCYAIDGNAEGLIDGQTGFAVAPFDVPQLGRRLEELVGDAARRREMGLAGRKFALARFDKSVMVRGLQAVYDGVCKDVS